MTTFADGQDPAHKVQRAQQSDRVGYTADSEDALGELEIYDALIDPNGQGGARSEKQAGKNGMMPPMMGGGGRGGAGEQNAAASGQSGNNNNAGASNSKSGGAGIGGGVQAAGMPVPMGMGGPGVSAAGMPAGPAVAPGAGIGGSGNGIASMPGGTMAAGGDLPGAVAPGMRAPGLGDSGANTPGIQSPGMDRPDIDRPGFDQPNLDQPGQDGLSPDQGINQPGQNSPDNQFVDWAKDKVEQGMRDGIDRARRGDGGGGQGGRGDLKDNNVEVDPDAVQGAGRAWDQIAEDMQAISRTAQELQAVPGSTFGFVHQPQNGYSNLRNDIQHWGSGAAAEFEKIGRDLGRDAQGYRDLASQQATTAKESQNV